MPWRPAQFKGKQVWVEVDAAGKPLVQGGRVPMRYSDKAGVKIYRAGLANLKPGEGPPVDLPEGVSADAAGGSGGGGGKGGGRGKKKGSGFGSAGSRTEAQSAAALAHAEDLIASFRPDVAVAYTDGACTGNPGPAGAGAVVQLPGGETLERHAALGRATNNVGELTAIDLALDLLDEAGWPEDGRVELLTDSKYSHGVLVLGWKAKANRELILGLRKRLEGRRVRIHWVAGHTGLDGNERADALARRGVEESR